MLFTDSILRKKRGFPPTGQLVSTAKATGYSSVSDMLQFTGIENIDQIKVLKDKSGSRKKIKVSNNVMLLLYNYGTGNSKYLSVC